MNAINHIFGGILATALLVSPSSLAQKGAEKLMEKPKAKSPPPPPPTSVAPPPANATTVFVYDQKPIQGRAPLVSPQQARVIVDRFKAAHSKMGDPRFLLYVNRELVDENSGLKLIARTEKTEVAATAPRQQHEPPKNATPQVVSENRYGNEKRPAASLADKQTARDVERLFGRPLRMAGAHLADQRVATQLIASRPFASLLLEGEQARKDREALSRIADVVIEILIASKDVQVTELTGDKVYSVPDIQATAIRLSDARIMGQASASDLYGGSPSPTLARNYGVHEITEATALALMEDMLTSYEPPAPAEKSEP